MGEDIKSVPLFRDYLFPYGISKIMNKDGIVKLLPDYPAEHVENFAAYCIRLLTAKKKDGSLQNPWMAQRTDEQMATLFKRVSKDGLVFDGTHITLQSTGISYDYIAYKNRMFLSYPESTVDVGLVYEGDDFKVTKESGSIMYHHNVSNPFNQGEKNLVGGYCIIRNKRGEFMTLLSKEDIDKHRKVAKQDYIWKEWFTEMATKTVIKKACKLHFSDIYQNIEQMDNENYELDNPLDLDIKTKQEIDAIQDIEDLKDYYLKNKGRGKEFGKYVTIRKQQINENTQIQPAK